SRALPTTSHATATPPIQKYENQKLTWPDSAAPKRLASSTELARGLGEAAVKAIPGMDAPTITVINVISTSSTRFIRSGVTTNASKEPTATATTTSRESDSPVRCERRF